MPLPTWGDASRYGPEPKYGIQSEGGGFTLSCVCGWIYWVPKEKVADALWAKHLAKKLKKCQPDNEWFS